MCKIYVKRSFKSDSVWIVLLISAQMIKSSKFKGLKSGSQRTELFLRQAAFYACLGLPGLGKGHKVFG
jgi:hypothetical protein